MMQTTLQIDAKLYENIVQWCDANGIEPIRYIEKALRERIATDKYGDLNEKMANHRTESCQITEKVEEQPTETTGKGTVAEETIQEINENPIKTPTETTEASGTDENTPKKKRTLKTK